jgi:hypothetical protein
VDCKRDAKNGRLSHKAVHKRREIAATHDPFNLRGVATSQTPKLDILTSESDYATGLWYSVERVFSTFFETNYIIEHNKCNHALSLNQGKASRKSIGHYLPLISHTLTPFEQEQNLRVLADDNMKNFWSGQIPGGSAQFGSTVLTHLDKTIPSNPYLNVLVDDKIISGHNDVLNKKVMDFIGSMIEMSTAD